MFHYEDNEDNEEQQNCDSEELDRFCIEKVSRVHFVSESAPLPRRHGLLHAKRFDTNVRQKDSGNAPSNAVSDNLKEELTYHFKDESHVLLCKLTSAIRGALL
jgi:hypothetical protein